MRVPAGTPIVEKRGLVRTNNGTTIHRDSCHHAQRGAAWRWLWADRVTLAEVKSAVAQFGYHECRRCNPLTRPDPPPYFDSALEGIS